MKKILFILSLLFAYTAQAQWQKPNNSYGTIQNGSHVTRALIFPTGCGVPPTLSSADSAQLGWAIYGDSCNNKAYLYNPGTKVWSEIGSGGSGGTCDTCIAYWGVSPDKAFYYSIRNNGDTATKTYFVGTGGSGSTGIVSYGKNTSKDSTILLLSDGTRYAARDSVGGGGSTPYHLPYNGISTNYLGGDTLYHALPSSGGGIDSVRQTINTDSIKQYSSGVGSLALLTPRVFNVKSYGAKPDGISDTTGAISSSSNSLTSSNSIFHSGDVGKIISVLGAGTSGTDLVTTIATFVSSTNVTLTTSASTTVTGRNIVFGTDQTTYIQAAINAAFIAGGGTVWIPKGFYIINGALQTINGVAMNSQLYIPALSTSTGDSLTHIQIVGETLPNFSQYGALNTAQPNWWKNGTVLFSTLNSYSSGAAIIGTKGVAGAYNAFNYNYLTVKNLTLKVLDNPSGAGPVIGGISYKYGASLIADKVIYSPIGIGGNSVTPTNSISGFETPDNSSETMSHLTNCVAEGVNSGFMLGEHAQLDQCQSIVCYYGFNLKDGYHSIYATRIGSYWCTNDLNILGNTYFDISDLDVEISSVIFSGGKWYDNAYTIKDSSNLGYGTVLYHLIQESGGLNNSLFAVKGASNIIANPLILPFKGPIVIGGKSNATDIFSTFGASRKPLLEINSGAAVGGTNFGSNLSFVTNTNSSGASVGNIFFANSNLGTGEKRVAQFNVYTDGATNSGGIYLTPFNAGTIGNGIFINHLSHLMVNTITDNSTLTVAGSVSTAYIAKSANYTATVNDHTIDCTGSGTFTITLPTAVGITGREYVITNSGTGTITIATTSSQTFTNFTGTPTTLSIASYGSYIVQSTGSNWIIQK